MKTVVYQSFRTENVPDWIARCMQSVREWAQSKDYTYRFWDDQFFDLVPREYFPRASAHKCVLSDYARLVAAKQLLEEGFDRAIWIDADALVFDPANFSVEIDQGYAFCREVWLDRTVFNRPQFRLTVNNSVSVFCRNETIIEFYLEVARRILAGNAPIGPLSIGTEVLRGLRRAIAFPLLTSVGIFGPEMAFRYLEDDGRFLRPYLDFQTAKVHAINLCLSKLNQTFRFSGGKTSWTLDAKALDELMSRLIADQGASFNKWYSGAYVPRPNEFERPLTAYLAARERVKDLLAIF